MIRKLDLEDTGLIRTLFDLQKASYLVEAELIRFYDIPTLKESFEEFLKCGEEFLGCFEGKELVGAISYKVTGEGLTICRMVVHPNHHRKGIAQMLLETLEISQAHCPTFTVMTGRDNEPAINLYKKNGYQWVSDRMVAPDFYISLFEKVLEWR